MTPRLRKTMLTVHVTSSVSFIGAVATFLAFAIAGVSSGKAQTVQAAYLAMDLTTWFVIVPLCFAALLTGLVQSLGTPWGLFRHYWVLVKLGLTLVSAIMLVIHTRPIGLIADAAATTTLASDDLRGVRLQLIAASVGALVVALGAVVLSIFKLAGQTRYGWRKQQEQRGNSRRISCRCT